MRAWAVLACLALLFSFCSGAQASPPAARHKPGPVTIRGVAQHVGRSSFTLVTTHKGSYAVAVKPQTAVTVKGEAGRATVHEGDHIGVRGFVSGTHMVAMTVRIYPIKAKPQTVRGFVTGIQSPSIRVKTAAGMVSARITGSTSVRIGTQIASIKQLRVGQQVRLRVVQEGSVLVALSVYGYRTTLPGHHLQVRGTVTSVGSAVLTISTGAGTTRVNLNARTRYYLGSSSGSSRDLRPGSQVTAYTCCSGGPLVATSVHIHATRSRGTRIHLVGVVVRTGSRMDVRSGGRIYRIGIQASTRVSIGAQPGNAGELRTGQTVTVYACCGSSPVASSVHVHVTSVRSPSELVQGQVTSVGGGTMRLATASGTVDVVFNSTTTFSPPPATSRSVRAGQRVSVRATQNGKLLIARSVHIDAPQKARTLVGTVVAVSGTSLQARGRAGVYAVQLAHGARVTLNGKVVPPSALRAGDRVRITVPPGAGSVLTASSVTAARSAPKLSTVRGTLVTVAAGTLIIADGSGHRVTVHLGPGVRPLASGSPVPPAAMFPGVRVEVKGYRSGSTMQAVSASVTVHAKAIQGRISAVSASSISVVSKHVSTHVDVPTAVAPVDGGRRITLRSLGVGTFMEVSGYEETSNRLLAMRLAVQHPSIDASATVVRSGRTMTVQSVAGDVYRVQIRGATVIEGGAAAIPLRPADIVAGMRLRVHGTALTNGTIAADEIAVKLASVTMRGTVANISSGSIAVGSATGTVSFRVSADVPVSQGSRAIALLDVVAGDDVTVYGYRLSSQAAIARKVLVHRRLVGVEGTFLAVTSNGFTVQTSGGEVQVITSADTIVTGGTVEAVVSGTAVHVTGFRRGDGAVVATRVRIGAKH